MTTSKNGIDLIKSFEGVKLNAYKDGNNIWTIGIGTTHYPDRKTVMPGDTCTESQAEDFLKSHIAGLENSISKLFPDFNQNQFDAIASLSYNIGYGAFYSSTLKKRIVENADETDIREAFMMWNKIGGKASLGLTNRRKAESDLYFKAVTG